MLICLLILAALVVVFGYRRVAIGILALACCFALGVLAVAVYVLLAGR